MDGVTVRGVGRGCVSRVPGRTPPIRWGKVGGGNQIEASVGTESWAAQPGHFGLQVGER